jgi:hypothetical protein
LKNQDNSAIGRPGDESWGLMGSKYEKINFAIVSVATSSHFHVAHSQLSWIGSIAVMVMMGNKDVAGHKVDLLLRRWG